MASFGKRGLPKPGADKTEPKSLIGKWRHRVMKAIKPAKEKAKANTGAASAARPQPKPKPKSVRRK